MPAKDRATKAEYQSRYLQRALIVMVDPEDKRHGSRTGYTVGCRCTRCKAADSDYRRTRRARARGRLL